MGADMNTLIMAASRTAPGTSMTRTDQQQAQIRNLPQDCTDFDLYKLCSPFGGICPKGVKAMLTQEGTCTGTGWVDFVTDDEAARFCQAMNGFNGLACRTKMPRRVAQPL